MAKSNLCALAAATLLAATAHGARANVLYFADPVNYDQGETDTLFLYGNAGIGGTVTSPNGFSSSFTIGANSVASVAIPSTYDLTSSGTVTNNGFVVATNSSSDNIGASILSRETATTDTTYLFNSTALGTSYYGVATANSISYPSQLTIVGTQAGTTVTVTPSAALASGQPAGTSFNITLGAGQAVLLADNGTVGSDLTGTQITSSAPVAVFGGNQCADVPATSTACDHNLTALPSTNNYTSRAVIPTTTGVEGSSSNIVRVLAATNGTVVMYNGVAIATLNAGQHYDFRSNAGGVLTASNPVLIAEYLTGQSEHPNTPGDPAISYIPGTDQWLSSYVFSTPVGTQAYDDNFLDLAIASADVPSLVLNGAAVPATDCTALAGSAYDTCEIAIAAGAGSISAADPFLLLIDGGTTYDSYFTFAGTTFSTGASPVTPVNPTPPTNPVPEPANISIFAAAISALWLVRRFLRFPA